MWSRVPASQIEEGFGEPAVSFPVELCVSCLPPDSLRVPFTEAHKIFRKG